jgi:uncharacterized 2Fe-2S/4Fe-4S cluster protein (DUF4445 family)
MVDRLADEASELALASLRDSRKLTSLDETARELVDVMFYAIETFGPECFAALLHEADRRRRFQKMAKHLRDKVVSDILAEHDMARRLGELL